MITKSITEIPGFEAGDLTWIKELLHPQNDQIPLNYSLAHASLAVNTASIPHILHANSEVYILVKGKGRVYIDEEEKELKTGELVFIPKGARQYIVNTGAEELQFLCIVSPPWSAEEEEVL